MLRKNRLTVAVSAALGLGAAAVMPSVANAQEERELLIEEVIVTGSRIQKANLVSASPVTQVDAQEFKFQGTTRVEDLMRNLPQVYSQQNTGISNGATGTATLNLRQLGDERTLVLVNGRRLPSGSPLAGGVGADINQIPGSLIRRVEVLTGGASATYGSDAVAGVVNFVMVDDFEGIEFDYQFSQYHHDNDNSGLQQIVGDAGFPFPDGSKTDGDIQNWSLIMGGNFDNNRGNITAYAGYREVDGVLQSERDYSACALNNPGTGCFGSGTSARGTFSDFGVLPATDRGDSFNFMVVGNEFVPNTEVYNYGPVNYYQRPDERYTAGAFGRYQLNEHVEAYTELMFMDNRTLSQIAPSGAFFVTNSLSCGNAFLSQQQFDLLCGNYGLTEDDSQTVYIGRRNVEGGGRQQDLRHTSYRGVFGVRGDINETWRYDLSGQYSEVSMENTYLNDFGTPKIALALDAVEDEDGNIVCRSGPPCVPWNIFTEGGVTPEQTEYLQLPLFARGTTEQKVFTGFVAGSLGDYGVKLPSANSGVEVVLGAEYRKESLDFNPDEGFRLGLGAGQGGATLPISGSFDVTEFFIETSIPLIEGAAMAEEVTLDLGYRYSDYSTGQETDTYGIRGGWAINQDVKLRASFQHAVRAANIRELFATQGLNLFDMAQDPCGGPTPVRSLEECARTGVTAGQYGNIANSPAGQYNTLEGGNPDAAPEEADTYSVGIVWSPQFVEDLTLSLDWYSIEIKQGIDELTPEFILNECLDGNDALCANVQRGTGGDLWIGSNVDTSGKVVSLLDNLAIEKVEGFDIVADYAVTLGSMGTLTANNTMSIIDKWDQQELASAPVEDCKGVWGGVCEFPKPDFRNNLRVTWLTPWDVTASVLWRHMSKIDDKNDTLDLPATNYIDVAGVWDVLENASIRAGVNNVFDRQPPIAGNAAGPSIGGNGNVFPGVYDALGRYMYLGVSVSF